MGAALPAAGGVPLSRVTVRATALGLVLVLLSATLLQLGPAGASPGDFVAIATVPVPSTLGVSVAFDGTTFYYTNYGDPTLYGYTVACSAGSCATTLTLATPILRGEGGSVRVDAMAWDGTRGVLWAGGLDDNTIYRLDPATGVATRAFSVASCNPWGLVDGLAYDGEDDTLWFSSDGSYSVCHYSVAGTLLQEVPVSGIAGFPPGCYNSGLAVGGEWLYLGSNGCGQILRVRKDTFTDGLLFASPGGRDEDMECDPVTFAPRSVIWSKDAYDNTATAFEIEAGTCGVGGLPPCTEVAPLAVDVTRPAPFTRYLDDIAYPSSSATPLVLGDLTLRASVGDASRVASAQWRIDGVPLAAGPAPDYAALWDASAAAPGRHELKLVVADVVPGCKHVGVAEAYVATPRSEAVSRALTAATTHPVEATLRSPGADGAAGPAAHRFLRHEEPTLGLVADLLEDRAESAANGSRGHASSVVARVSLLGGRIQAEALHAEADARLRPEDATVSLSPEGSRVVGLVVDGTPVVVDEPDTVVEVPGVGRLVLLETERVQTESHAEVRVRALHLYAAAEGFRGEVILGAAAAGVALDGTPFAGLSRSVDPADDAGTRGDVGDTPQTARALQAPALFGARLAPGDRADWYKVALKEGEKVEVVVKPAERLGLRTGQGSLPPTLATAQVEQASVDTDLALVLRDPSGDVVLRSDAPLTAPERIELNVDVDGDWTVGVLGEGASTNYTFSLAVTPVAFAPQVPVGASCGDPAAPLLGEGRPVVDAMRGSDERRWFRLPARIGDDLTVTLHPLDADGADFDLYLYDRGCRLQEWSALGKPILWPGDVPKGVPDAVAVVPNVYTGDYWVEVLRHEGVGNYLLVGQSNTVLPTLPLNDALTGADASDDPTHGTPLAAPGAWEGRWEEGDPRDAYAFDVPQGMRLVVTFLPSPANLARLSIVDASGLPVPLEEGLDTGMGAFAVTAPAGAASRWTVVLDPTLGGGNYAFSVAAAPAA